jgi:hypothetical protein
MQLEQLDQRERVFLRVHLAALQGGVDAVAVQTSNFI